MSIVVSFEGPDAVGKETQAKMLCNFYNSQNIKSVYYEFPLNDGTTTLSTTTYSIIKRMLISGQAQKYPLIFQTVQFFNKLFFNIFKLPKLLSKYDIVILDRWSASVLIYGLATGVNKKIVTCMFKLLRHADITIILNGSSFNKDNKDSYEKDDLLQRTVQNQYDLYYIDYLSTNNIKLIEANKKIKIIHQNIVSYIKSLTGENL